MNSHHESEVQTERNRLEKEVDGLRRLLLIKRRNISTCSQDLIDYCLSNVQQDAFLTKIPSSKNPFRETGGLPLKNCALL
jgi:hypothetical protein